MNQDVFWQLVTALLDSFQLRTILGMIVLDVVLGIASALALGVFDVQEVAAFYRTKVLPALLGYGVLYVVISYVLPPNGVQGLDNLAVTAAWGVLEVTLLGSVYQHLHILFPFIPALPQALTGGSLRAQAQASVKREPALSEADQLPSLNQADLDHIVAALASYNRAGGVADAPQR